MEGMKDTTTLRLNAASNKKNPWAKTKLQKDWEIKMEAWKEVPSIDCNTTSKKVGIKAWHWCKHHMAFTIQKLQDCKIGSNNHRASKHCQGSFQELLMEEDDNISCIKALLASIYAQDDDHK